MSEDTNAAADAGQQTGQADAASKQSATAAPDGANDRAKDMVSRAEMEKVIGERQAAKERARTLEAQLAEVNQKLTALPPAEQLEAFGKWQADKDAQARDQAIKQGDVEAIETRVKEPLLKQIKAAQDRAEALKAQLTVINRDNALLSAAQEAGALNPKQVVQLLRSRVRMSETPQGQFVPEFLDDDGQRMYDANAQHVADAKTFVGMFLSLPENANLVKAQAAAGSGAKAQTGQGQQNKPRSLEEFNALNPEARARIAGDMTLEDWAAMGLTGGPAAKPKGFL